MDNQHKLIKGYRDLSKQEIDLMNKVKVHAELTKKLVDEVRDVLWECSENQQGMCNDFNDSDTWVIDAKKDLQVGFMKLVRSIAKPTSF